jgi:hypothetical protein
MEIREVVSYYLNTETNILEVTFRTIDDSEELIRTDNIEFNIVQEYGYDLVSESFDFFSEFDEDVEEEDVVEFDTQELMSFLNEYYEVNPHIIPEAEIY